MTAKDFDLIIIESFMHEAKQTYFNAKRKQFKCSADEYFAGLMNSFKRLNDEVNKTDYLFALVTTPEGEEREYSLSSDSISEQRIFLETIGKVSFPNKRTIDLRKVTNEQFSGFLTAGLMVELWPELSKYCQSIIDAKTKKLQKKTKKLQKLRGEEKSAILEAQTEATPELIKSENQRSDEKEPENPHSRYFVNGWHWQLFNDWHMNHVRKKSKLADYSFIYWVMLEDEFIHAGKKQDEFIHAGKKQVSNTFSGIGQKEFKVFLENKLQTGNLGRQLKQLGLVESEQRYYVYSTLIEKYKLNSITLQKRSKNTTTT